MGGGWADGRLVVAMPPGGAGGRNDIRRWKAKACRYTPETWRVVGECSWRRRSGWLRLGGPAEEADEGGEGPDGFEDDEGVELDYGGGEEGERGADEVEEEVGPVEPVHGAGEVEDEGDEDEGDAD